LTLGQVQATDVEPGYVTPNRDMQGDKVRTGQGRRHREAEWPREHEGSARHSNKKKNRE